MPKWPKLSDDQLLKKLTIPAAGTKKLDMVLDTDTYNEVDDQFAVCYSLCSPERLNVEAIYAAPFFNERSTGPEQGMELSYDEIVRLTGKLGYKPEGFVYKGSRGYLPDMETPQDSPAARDLVRRGMAHTEDDPLYVVSIAAITNVASALIMEPELVRRIVVVWLGGQPLSHPFAREFNLSQDLYASRTIFDCGVPLVLIPCQGVASHLLTTVQELQTCMGGVNDVCDTLIEILSGYREDHFGWAKEIWDISTIGMLNNPDWIPSQIEPSPILTEQHTYSRDFRRHPIRVAYYLHRNPIFQDMFKKLRSAGK